MRRLIVFVISAILMCGSPSAGAAQTDISSDHSQTPPGEDEYLLVINRDNPIKPAGYTPGDLVEIADTRQDGRPAQRMRRDAAQALEAMLAEARINGISGITVTSGYRSYAEQAYIYGAEVGRQLALYGDIREAAAAAARRVAPPGMSEHQSGLCADIHNLECASPMFADTTEYKWIAENAHRFGFILRYPEGKERMTGVVFEPWHFRYVGTEHALAMKVSGMCLEEYAAVSRRGP